jgi:S1-C subfamily serine protease
MNKIKISEKLSTATYLLSTFYGEDPFDPENVIAIGSGVAINNKGYLLTTAHTITNRLPIRFTDVQDPHAKTVAKTKYGNFSQYTTIHCGIQLTNPLLKKPIQVDLAILKPLKEGNNVPFLNVCFDPIKLGLDVMMAGFPDDMEVPFEITENIDTSIELGKTFSQNLRGWEHLLMIKSGMIGSLNPVTLSDGKFSISGDIFYIDNSIHSGASGGPVVNERAEIIGIITQRAMTKVDYEDTPNLSVPSGSTVAISPRFISHWIDEINHSL